MDKSKGFTLVELLITLGVAAILLSLAAPSFQNMIMNNQRAAQINEFVSSLIFLRSEALKRGHVVSMCRTSGPSAAVPTCGSGDGWEDGWVIFDDPDGNNVPDSADDVLRTHAALPGNGIKLRGTGALANIIGYTASGRTNGTLGTFTWCDARGGGTDARVITIPLSGRVSTTAGNTGTSC